MNRINYLAMMNRERWDRAGRRGKTKKQREGVGREGEEEEEKNRGRGREGEEEEEKNRRERK